MIIMFSKVLSARAAAAAACCATRAAISAALRLFRFCCRFLRSRRGSRFLDLDAFFVSWSAFMVVVSVVGKVGFGDHEHRCNELSAPILVFLQNVE